VGDELAVDHPGAFEVEHPEPRLGGRQRVVDDRQKPAAGDGAAVAGVGVRVEGGFEGGAARTIGQIGQPFSELGPVGGAETDRHRGAGSQGEAGRNDARLHAAGASTLMLMMLPFGATYD
jgi:hypothetical protein